MKSIFCGLAIMALLTTVGPPIQAHHSLSAYDITKSVEITGTVKKYEWSAPHCWLIVTVSDGKGGANEWVLEAGTPVVNYKYGWTRDNFKVGDKVTVTLFPTRDGSRHGAIMSVVIPDGRKLDGPLATYLKK